jgi:hypothetical protein
MANPYRTHTCNDLRASHAGQTVRLAGWIHNKRDLGGVLFIDLRDHYGITQIVIPPTAAFQDDALPSAQGNGHQRPRPGPARGPKARSTRTSPPAKSSSTSRGYESSARANRCR